MHSKKNWGIRLDILESAKTILSRIHFLNFILRAEAKNYKNTTWHFHLTSHNLIFASHFLLYEVWPTDKYSLTHQCLFLYFFLFIFYFIFYIFYNCSLFLLSALLSKFPISFSSQSFLSQSISLSQPMITYTNTKVKISKSK